MEWLKNLTTAASDAASSARNALSAEYNKFKNKENFEALVAASVMVSAADGHIDPEEKERMCSFFQRTEGLKDFSTADIKKTFDKYATAHKEDPDFARIDMLRAIGRLKSKPEDARSLVRLACLIGAQDGNFDDDEKKVVRAICRELGLDAADFEL
jgi:tellurite resistance protein TerB